MRDDKGALLALNRFGYGSRGDGDLVIAASDPRGFVLADLQGPDIGFLGAPGLTDSATDIERMFADQAEKRQARELAAREAANAAASAVVAPAAQPTNAAAPAAKPQAAGIGPPPAATAPAPAPPSTPSLEQAVFRAEALARIRRAIECRLGLVERLVAFWSNHFCVSAGKSQFGRITVGAFEREAIRPHVLGRFADMLLAVESHPAMLHYLDNAQSIGPGSAAGVRSGRGLNENLAREIMELHTLGVGSGYTQGDVTSFAKVLTGWTSAGPAGGRGAPGRFVFNAAGHEPGPQTVLARTYADEGAAQGHAVLADLARQPATAKFIARKFAAHFLADAPPEPVAARLADVFRRTDGDLKALTLTLVGADEVWAMPPTKMRTPYDYLIAVHRALGRLPEDPGAILGPMNVMGMPLWTPPGPNGFPDTEAAWGAPEGLKLRLDFAANLTDKMRDPPNAGDLADALFGPAAHPELKPTLARAATRGQGLALLFMSPDMQRR